MSDPVRFHWTWFKKIQMDEISAVKNEVKYAEWIAMIEECRRSSLSIRSWHEENNVNLKTYNYRLRRLRTIILDQRKNNTDPGIKRLSVVASPVPVSNNVMLHLECLTILPRI